jgi:hypothetical protein
VRRISDEERRARLAVRHHLHPDHRAADLVTLADDLVGIHATEPTSVYLGPRARVDGLDERTVARELYEERSILRLIGMRRTMFVVPPELGGVLTEACGRSIAVAERARLEGMLAGAGITTTPGPWLRRVEAATIKALEEAGELTAIELTARVPALGHQIAFGEGRKWAGKVGVSTRVLFLLSMDSRIVRARPKGTWLSSTYRWAPIATWLGRPLSEPPLAEARTELVRRWLRTYGPGTIADLRWWTGWPLRDVRAALAGLETLEVELEGGAVGIVLADDIEPTPPVAPWAALLPTLDTSIMGWSERAWYLGAHKSQLFDSNGNAGPTIWWNGRIVGGWGQDSNARVVVRLFEDVGHDATQAIETEAAALEGWLARTRVIPRFRTPTEQEIEAG